ncbi:SO2930 family diheme c-type cytochrome [Qipengyuania gaetbuli]|uniref:SO2930 family diheme c-type cytochrome n=1 Tax=Qipengyuania gaetbuli TaxID=266952 RepID=UPI001CFEEAF4|nr:SO2930 family diheme c-type cytochrome [Qipengyuania gaetbuli]
MKSATALLAAASLALAGSVAARADFFQPVAAVGAVNDDAVVQGMPRLLSQFGFFTDGAGQAPAARVTPYRLNTPLYSDGAEKLRFVYVPEGKRMEANGDGLIDFPVGTALIKTFAFGEGRERRLIETRVLLHRESGWVALPYVWNAEQTDAALAIAGARMSVVTPAGEAISYRVPNKNQCKECHGLDDAVIPIGPKARNLSGEWLAANLGEVPAGAERLVVWEKRGASGAEAVARAYLDVNCAHCHRPGATASNSGLDLRWEQDDPHALGVMKRPVAAGRGAGGLLFDVVPGDPDQSILLHRMLSNDPGVAMPELGKSSIDREGTEAVRRWIEEMPK